MLLCSASGTLVIGGDAFFSSGSQQRANRLPAIYPFREFAAAASLVSYGGNLADSFRLVGIYAGRFLKGEKLRICRCNNSPKSS